MNITSMKKFAVAVVILSLAPISVVSASPETVNPATWRPRERWRGFNLEGKGIKGSFNGEWREDDLRMIHEFGFNFARIMIDYRYWSCDDDWTKPDPAKFPSIDKMIGWGKKYKVHIQICFCTPPGMQLKPRSKKPLFTDAKVQDVMAEHWAYFARRYRDIPNDELSFNLFNEPDGNGTEENYLPLVKKLVAAIHKEDPKRFIVIDGLDRARKPLLGAIDLPVGQSHHAYIPSTVSHYKAGWLKNSSGWRPDPEWPPSPATSPLFGSYKPDKAHMPFVINDMPEGTLTINTKRFNKLIELIVEADGKQLFSRCYRPSPNEPGWTNVVECADKKSWSGYLIKPIAVNVPACKKLSIRCGRGDWLELKSVEISSAGKTATLPFTWEWDIAGRRELRFAGFDNPHPFRLMDGSVYTGATYFEDKMIKKWKPVLDAGQFMMIGETGCFNKTPHDVALRWLEDNLRIWKDKGISWAMWGFRGTMSILNSGRTDVEYEDYQGLKLDRKMLELLQKY